MADAKASRLNAVAGQGGPLNDGISKEAREGTAPATVVEDGIAPAEVITLPSGNTQVNY